MKRFAIAVINAWNRRAVIARAEPGRYHPSSGFRRPDQVDPILTATGLELSDEDLDAIEGRSR